MVGLLKKLNSSGVWKDRYGQLNNTYFMTYKPKNGKPTSEIKESIDLRQADSVTVYDGTLKIILSSEEEFIYKGDNINQWLRAVKERMRWIEDEAAKNSAKSVTDTNRVHKAGVLKKKSHNKYQGFQVSCSSFNDMISL